MKKKRYSSTAVEFPSTYGHKHDRQSILKRFIHAHAPTRTKNNRTMRQDVIISIRHQFAEKIYSNKKLYEFRKRQPNIAIGTRCWIYEPLPIGKITGFFIYRGCYRDEKMKIWKQCKEKAGINKEAFMQYYDRDFYAHAWKVGLAHRCKDFDLKDVGIDRAPQSYIKWSSEYLDNKASLK